MDSTTQLSLFVSNGPHLQYVALTGIVVLAVLAVIYRLNLSKQHAERSSTTHRLQRRMSNIGFTTLATESDSNLSIPVSVMKIDGKVTKEALISRLQERITQDNYFVRYRSVAIGEERTFVEIPDYDVNGNVHSHVLAEGETALSYVESIVNTPLDMSKPLWEMHVIEDPTNDKVTNVAWKLHHCIGDGASISIAMLKLSDQADEYKAMVQKIKDDSKAKPKKTSTLLQKLTFFAQFVALSLWSWYVITRKLVAMVVRAEPATIFKQPGNKSKRLSYNMMYSVADTKSVGKQYGATVNDVMLNCIAGAMRKTLLASGAEVSSKLTLRAAIPVDMRSATESNNHSRNKFSALLIDFPVGVADPVKRLKLIKGGMNEAKNSLEKLFTYYTSLLLPRLSVALTKMMVGFSSSRVSVAISNVRASSFNIAMCGGPLLGFFGFVPPPPSVNLGVAVLSVGDNLGLNVLVDTSVGIDGQTFLKYAKEEFDALKAAATTKRESPIAAESDPATKKSQ